MRRISKLEGTKKASRRIHQIKLCNYASTPIHSFTFFYEHQNTILEKVADYLTTQILFSMKKIPKIINMRIKGDEGKTQQESIRLTC